MTLTAEPGLPSAVSRRGASMSRLGHKVSAVVDYEGLSSIPSLRTPILSRLGGQARRASQRAPTCAPSSASSSISVTCLTFESEDEAVRETIQCTSSPRRSEGVAAQKLGVEE
jgi:hypothetical protein